MMPDATLNAEESGFNLAFALIDYLDESKQERSDTATLKAYMHEWGIPTSSGGITTKTTSLKLH